MIHLMAMYRSFVLYPAGWLQMRVRASSVMKREKVVSEIHESFDSVSVRNATIKETSDGAHPE